MKITAVITAVFMAAALHTLAQDTPLLFSDESIASSESNIGDINCSELKERLPDICAKLPMTADGIIRLSKVEVYPAYLNDYMKFATEVGEISLRTEPGVLTMYAMQEKDNPCYITILETYASQEAYRKHIASPHFQKYKQGTLHMVRHLILSDQTVLNPANRIVNYME